MTRSECLTCQEEDRLRFYGPEGRWPVTGICLEQMLRVKAEECPGHEEES